VSYAPQTLLDARTYLRPRTGLPWASLGIVGDTAHDGGYHCGEDRLIPDDYSARTARDRAGLTDAASALDIGSFPRLVLLTSFLTFEARAGRLGDVRELIGPGGDGRAYRWDHLAGWSPVRRAAGDSHETHLHISYYRDSERRSKLGPFQRFFEPREEDMPLTNDDVKKIFNTDGIIRAPSSAATAGTNQFWTAASYLASIRNWAVAAAERAAKIEARQVAILAAVTDDDTAAQIEGSLTAFRTVLLEQLGEVLVPAVLAGLREQLDDVADERLVAAAEAGVRAALGGLDQPTEQV
jgi:hypothetical protein